MNRLVFNILLLLLWVWVTALPAAHAETPLPDPATIENWTAEELDAFADELRSELAAEREATGSRDYVDEYMDAYDLPNHPEVKALVQDFETATGLKVSLTFIPSVTVTTVKEDLEQNKSGIGEIFKKIFLRIFRAMGLVKDRLSTTDLKNSIEYRQEGDRYFFPGPNLSGYNIDATVLDAALTAFDKHSKKDGYKDLTEATPDLIKGLTAYFNTLKAYKELNSDCASSDISEKLKAIARSAKVCTGKEETDLVEIADADFEKLCLNYRIDLIKCVDNFPSQGTDDQVLIKLLKTTPVEHRQNLLIRLEKDRIYENRLIAAVDGEEFLELINTVSQWLGQPTQADWEEAVISKKILFFDGDDGFSADFQGESMLFKTRKNFNISWSQEVSVKPHEFVAVTFTNDYIIAGQQFSAGNQVAMSGLAVWSLFNEMFNKQMRVVGAGLLDVPLLLVGIGEINALKNAIAVSRSIRALRYAKATSDIIIATGGLVMASGIEDELGLTEEGRATLQYWTWFNLIYAGGTLTPHAINSAKGLYSSCKNLLAKPNISASLRVTIQKWMETLRDVFKRNGNNIEELVEDWNIFSKIKMKIPSIDADGWLMGKYVNGELQVVGNTNVAQKWDYIVKADGQILVGRKHSWLSQGEDVLAAGVLKYNNGKLVEISNASGHYLPSTDEASNFLRIFRQAGIKVDDATLTILKSDGTIFKQISPTAGDRLNYY